MQDLMSSIRNITPSYPVRPVQPPKRDEERRDRPPPRREPEAERPEDDDDDATGRRPIIDERV